VSQRLLRVSSRIRSELKRLDRVLDRVNEGIRQARWTSDDLYWDSVALNLHGFYAGLERLFEMIAGTVDGSVPGSGGAGVQGCAGVGAPSLLTSASGAAQFR